MIINIIDRIYYWFPQSNIIWRSMRYGIRILANLHVKFLMPIHSKVNEVDRNTLIISLTSYPARINNVWMTCATLLNQNADNIHIVLWLSNDQFPNGMGDLPRKLLQMRKKGLDIRFIDDDLRPHKKYIYSLKEYPDNDMVTVDDDILYNSKLVSSLIKSHLKHPNCVICNRGITISREIYKNWKSNIIYDEERYDIMPTGIGGVFYPAHIFDGTLVHNVQAIKATCLNGDDLWLNLMTRISGYKVVQTGLFTGLVTILSSQGSALCNENIERDRNDTQIRLISKWAEHKLDCDYFINIDNKE